MLNGLRVLELGIWVAGPAAGGIFADWGADVVKVEAPSGDPQRQVFGALGIDVDKAPPFELDNRGKRSVSLDLHSEAGSVAMDRLIESADVFLTNLRPAALERLGLGHDKLLERYPRLVYASLTGYGLTGPDRDRPGYDLGAFWARSSMGQTLVPPEQLPFGIRSGIGDHVTAIATVSGVLAALIKRERTGQGGLVATSLLRSGIYCMGWDIGVYLRFGRLQRTRPRDRMLAPLINCYRAADGRGFWLLGLEQDRHWPGLVRALERPELQDDRRFATARLRASNAEALIAVLDKEFGGHPLATWVQRFDANDVWWAPINTVETLIADPQAIASGAFVEMPTRGDEPSYRAVASPVEFSGAPLRIGPVPAIGEHTAEVMAELGYSIEQIAQLA